MNAALDAGADDLRDDGDSWEVVSAPDAFPAVKEAVEKLGIERSYRKAAEARIVVLLGDASVLAEGALRVIRGEEKEKEY